MKVRFVPEGGGVGDGGLESDWRVYCGDEKAPCSSQVLAKCPHLAPLLTSDPTCSSPCCPTCTGRTVILDGIRGKDFVNLKAMFEMGRSFFLSEEDAGGLRAVARVMGVEGWTEEEEVEEPEVQPQQVPSGDTQVTRLINYKPSKTFYSEGIKN